MVVTIVVLIILATISISTAIGNKGILSKAETSKGMVANTTKQSEKDINVLLSEYANMMVEPPTPQDITADTPVGTEVKAPSDWTSNKVTPISDGSGHAIPLPDGFYYVGGDRSTGLVISDNSADEGKGTSYEVAGILQGNQYVWIPVDSEEDLTRTNFDDSGNPTTDAPSAGMNMTDCSEPYSKGYETEEAEYNTMKTQVLLYGGFYIGRYEAGKEDTILVCKKGVTVYNNIWGDDAGTRGAVYLATQEGYTSVTSTLTYGCQWDAMCRYIGDSERTTPTKGNHELTGNVSTDVSKNIYDLAGNCREWTMEASSYPDEMVIRGGYYRFDYPVYYRSSWECGLMGFLAFRISLYIK